MTRTKRRSRAPAAVVQGGRHPLRSLRRADPVREPRRRARSIASASRSGTTRRSRRRRTSSPSPSCSSATQRTSSRTSSTASRVDAPRTTEHVIPFGRGAHDRAELDRRGDALRARRRSSPHPLPARRVPGRRRPRRRRRSPRRLASTASRARASRWSTRSRPSRPAYTHKAATYRADGALAYGRTSVLPAAGALASLDWTRSLANRTTRWKWASFSTHAKDGTRLGLNLCARTSTTTGTATPTRTASSTGTDVRALGGVRFELPSAPRDEPWRIKSRRATRSISVFDPVRRARTGRSTSAC